MYSQGLHSPARHFPKVCIKVHECIKNYRLCHHLVYIWSSSRIQVKHAQYQLAQCFTVLIRDRRKCASHDLQYQSWQILNEDKSTLDNSPPPNYDKESKDECHHVNNNPRYKWYVKPAAFQVIAPTRSNYGRKINGKNRNKSTILIFLPAIIELVQELLISNMHNKLEEDTCENVEVIAPTRSNY